MAAPRTRTAPPRKRTVPKAPTQPVDAAALDFEPIRLVSRPDAELDERVPLFFIDDEPYTIPRIIPAGVALEYLRVIAEVGETAATPMLLSRLLGEDAYQALEDSPSLSIDELQSIMRLATRVAFGDVEEQDSAGGKGRGR